MALTKKFGNIKPLQTRNNFINPESSLTSMSLRLPHFSFTQTDQNSFKGHKATLSALLKTQHLKTKFTRYSSQKGDDFFLTSQERPNNSNQSQEYKRFPYRNNNDQKGFQFGRHVPHSSLLSSHSKKFIKTSGDSNGKPHQKKMIHFLKSSHLGDSIQNLMVSPTPPKMEQKQREPSYFVSGNLESKMNEYLNILIQKSDENQKEKLREIEQINEKNRIKKENQRFSSQNHYCKIMKASNIRRKRNSQSQEIDIERYNENKLEEHIKHKSQLLRRTEKIAFNATQIDHQRSDHFVKHTNHRNAHNLSNVHSPRSLANSVSNQQKHN